MSLAGLLLGVINIAIVVAVLVLIGLVIMWFMSWMGLAVPDQVKKVYMIIVVVDRLVYAGRVDVWVCPASGLFMAVDCYVEHT